MNKSKEKTIKEKIKQLTTSIKRWNRLYYGENVSEVSDAVYDQNFEELKQLEREYPHLKQPDTPTASLGFAPSSHFKKFRHQKPMLSLNNAFSKADLIAFAQRMNKFTNQKHTYYCEPKVDGLSITLLFEKNKLVIGATRGNGEIGENVTENVKATAFWQEFVNKQNWDLVPTDFEVRGEVFLGKQDFLQLNAKVYPQTLAELKLKFQKQRTILLKILESYFFGLNLANQEQNLHLPQCQIEDNLELLIKEGNLSLNRIKGEFYLRLHYAIPNVKEMIERFVNDLAKQKKFSLVGKPTIANNTFALTLLFSINLENKLFTSARNVASGSLRQLDSEVTKQRTLSCIFYEVVSQQPQPDQTQQQSLAWLKKKGFPISQHNRLCHNLEEVFAYLDEIEKIKTTFNYDIDGIVIKVNEHKFYPQIGQTVKFPSYAIAFKYPSTALETALLDIFATVGRTGKITYNAKLKSIFLANTIVKAATLHNAKYIEDLDIRVGDYVFVKKAGDIIPKVVSVNLSKRQSTLSRWVKTTQCPSCQTTLSEITNEVDQYCFNDQCEEKQIQSLIHFVSRQAMDIFGLSEQNIRTFWNHNLIKNFTDFFKLKEKETQIWALKNKNNVLKIGFKSLNNLFQAVEKAKQNSLEKLLFGLNIRYLGFKAARTVAKHFGNIDRLINIKQEEIMAIAGFGPVLAQSIAEFFARPTTLDLINEFKQLRLNLTFLSPKLLQNNFFSNKNVVITGVFAFASRSELTNQLQQRGANILNTVSTKVDFLVVGNAPGSKLVKAQRLKIAVLNETKISELLMAK